MMLRISLGGDVDGLASADLEELAENLSDAGVPVERTTLAVSGVKDVLTIGIAIASLTVSSISTLIAAVNFWKSQRKTKYRLKIDTGTAPIEREALDVSDISTAMQSERSVSLVIEKG